MRESIRRAVNMIRPPAKDPYTPSTEKRYEISEDEFSRARIKLLRDIHHKLETELGIQISFSIFGSLVKGKKLTAETAPRADIDMWVDIDSASLPPDKTTQTGVKENILKRLLSEMEKNKDSLGLASVDLQHTKARILDETSVRNALRKALKPKFFRIEQKYANINLASFFTLSIGEPIKKYRNMFLKDLASDPDKNKSKLIWQMISTTVEKMERKGEPVPTELRDQFPRTVEEALKFYGVRDSA